MDNKMVGSELSMSKLDEVLCALNHNISAQNDKIEECVSILGQYSTKSDIFIPEENHKDLKNSLDILCRLPSLFIQFTNNSNAIGLMDTSTLIQKYNKVAGAIEEINKKLAEMVEYSEKCIDSVTE